MKAMKRFAAIMFICVFALNTTVLAAKASACKMENAPVSAEKSVNQDMPDCHKKTSQKQGNHCKGVCFCQHIQAQSFAMPMMKIAVAVPSVIKAQDFFEKPEFLKYSAVSARFRPPIILS